MFVFVVFSCMLSWICLLHAVLRMMCSDCFCLFFCMYADSLFYLFGPFHLSIVLFVLPVCICVCLFSSIVFFIIVIVVVFVPAD